MNGAANRFDVRRDPVLGEEVWLARSRAGLPVRVVPTGRFREAVAVMAVRYGSTDLGFVRDGERRHQSPEGVAHYLEHKLFEDEDLHVFERFGRRGASVNATTSFARTSYFFQATSQFDDNLRDLLHLVANLHVTPENVEKERGIIAQEIRMYEDSPEYRGFFDLLGCFYEEHPVRHPVGGTVESIQAIDAAELETCHNAFYRTGNAAVAVAGPVEPDRVLELCDACALPDGDAAQGLCPEDLAPVTRKSVHSRMEVARPRLLVGFKERSLVAEPLARRRRDLQSRIVLDRLFGAASEIRESLHTRGLVDDSLSASYLGEATFGFVVVVCETDKPADVEAALREVFTQPLTMTEDHLERARRKMLGHYVRSFDALQTLSFGHVEDGLDGVEPFSAVELMRSLTVEEIVARHRELCEDEAFASAVVTR